MQSPLREELAAKIKKQPWREATTYKLIAPHEYFIEHQNQELFNALSEAITKYGEDSLFRLNGRTNKYKCLSLGEHRYWRIEEVLNRCKLSDLRFVDGLYEPNLPKKI